MKRSIQAIMAVGAVGMMAIGAPALAQSFKIGTLEIKGKPAEIDTNPFAMFGGGEPTLRTLVDAIHSAATSASNNALLVRLKDAQLSMTQTEELGAAMDAYRQTGKQVWVFGEGFATSDLLLASHADRVLAQPHGPVMFPGLYMEEMFLADTLAWVGIKADMVQIGDYKGAAEQMSRTSPSPAWDQNISQLLDSMYDNMRAHIKDGRHMNDAELDHAMEASWFCDTEKAVEVGLIDSPTDLTEIEQAFQEGPADHTISWSGSIVPKKANPMAALANPFGIFAMLAKKPEQHPTDDTIAVLHINGVIVDGDSSSGGLFGGGSNVGARTVRNAIEDILGEDLIHGVVVRIDSPGGSATASETIWRGIRRLAEKKPVWVSVGGMAASGGYYIAVAGDKIYVNPSSIVGSIGVVGGKMALDGLYDLLKVHVHPRTRGPMANMFRSTKPWTEQELTTVRTRMTETYELFTRRVSVGREGIDLSKTAEGRLFTGNKAIGLRMADEIGGLDKAITDMADSLSLTSYDVMDYPTPKSIEEYMQDMFGGMAKSPVDGKAAIEGMAKTVLGDKAWPQVQQALEGAALLQKQPVILMTPSVLIEK